MRALALRKQAGIRVMSEALREMMSVRWKCFSWSLRDMYSRTGASHKGMMSGDCNPLVEGETGEEIMFFVTRRCLTFWRDDVDMAVSWGGLEMTILHVLRNQGEDQFDTCREISHNDLYGKEERDTMATRRNMPM